ncbi:MAG: hypothetical protein ACYC2K_14570 [Gemmatimonadales bacterium]
MLFRQAALDGIQAGAITLAFRRWRRPTVRSGGTLLTPVGQLTIGTVAEVAAAEISDSEAQQAGYADRSELLAELDRRAEGSIYRIEFTGRGPDPRIALREAAPTDGEIATLLAQLARLDARSASGPWTASVIDVIAAHPAIRAGNLARLVGMERDVFKTNVRKLKALGLTESLEIGYRLAPRGLAVKNALAARE